MHFWAYLRDRRELLGPARRPREHGVDPRRVMMMVEDEGDGFDHEFFLGKIEEKDAFDRAKERMREGGRGGLGILLMHRCSDRLEYLGKGNVVRIEKRLHA